MSHTAPVNAASPAAGAAPAVLWFRRDLRVHDLPALSAAMARGAVAPLFVFDAKLIGGRWASPNRWSFLLASLSSLDSELHARGTRLHIRFGDPVDAVPAFARASGAAAVFVSRDYAPYDAAGMLVSQLPWAKTA